MNTRPHSAHARGKELDVLTRDRLALGAPAAACFALRGVGPQGALGEARAGRSGRRCGLVACVPPSDPVGSPGRAGPLTASCDLRTVNAA